MSPRKPNSWLRRALGARWLPLKLGIGVAAAALALQWLGLFEPLEEHFANMHFAWRGPLPPSGKVAVVGVGRDCTRPEPDGLGPWPWPRRRHAELIEKLAAAGAKAICFDIYFPDRLGNKGSDAPGEGPTSAARRAAADNDARMADAARRAGNVVLAVYRRGALDHHSPREGPLLRVPELAHNVDILTKATDQGHINVPDGTIRRVPAGFLCRGKRYYELAVLGAARYLGMRPDDIRPEARGLWLGDRFVPVGRSGDILINYYRFPDQTRPYFVSEVLAGRVRPDAFRDKLVMVGQTIHGARDADLVMTPEGVRFGVFVQATLADNILSRRMLRRVGPLPMALLIVAFSLASAWSLFARRAVGKVAWGLAFAAVAVLGSHFVFEKLDLLLDLAPCLAVVAGNLAGALVAGIVMADREVVRRDMAMATLVEAGRLSADGSPVEIPARIVSSIGRAMGVEGCCLFLRNAEGLELAASYGFGGELTAHDAAAASAPVNQWVADERKAFLLDRASSDGPVRLADRRIHSALIIPLLSHDEFYGTLGLYNKRPSEISPSREFTDHDLRLISLLTQQVAMTIERAHLADELAEALRSLEAAQEQLIESERLSAVGRMANMIIHDIKNPMQGVRMFAEMAGEADLSPEDRREFSQTMCREIDRLVGMCQEILDFARGTSSLLKEDIFLDDFLMEILLTLGPELENCGVKLATDLAFGRSLSLDGSRVKRVVLNLFRNAIEAMAASGGGQLSVKTTPRDGLAHIEIADTGPGIPDEIVDALFEPFVTHGKDHGTGLGLAIAKRIIEDHEGTIDFATQAGQGTTFSIEVPARLEAHEP